MNLDFEIFNRKNLAIIGGIMQLLVLIASFSAPKILEWKKTFKDLPKIHRQIFWLYGAYIVLAILGQSLFSLIFADDIALGTKLAKTGCIYITIFWGIRLIYQWIFDLKEYLTNRFIKLCYHFFTLWLILITGIYIYLSI